MIICFSNFKGGVAKTTTTINIGAALAKEGKRVLLIDMDPQFNLTSALRVEPAESNIYQIMSGHSPALPVNLDESIDIIPSHIELIRAEVELSSRFKREEILTQALKPIKDDYDFILIDCPPSIGTLTINAMMAADWIIVPLEPEHLALTGYSVLSQTLEQIGLEIDRIVITKYDGRTVLHRDIASAIREGAGDKVFKTEIRRNISLAEATAVGEDVFTYAPQSNGAKDYKSLTKEIISHVKKEF